MTSAEIRQQFLAFFESKKHQIVPSASIVVKNDPTLLFTNAGMNQFKDYFLGNKKPDNPRIADTQKCLRVSGKHNDLEEVGVDTYHHTMFEMLGNWSFGDYFKAEAIAWSWELLTEVYKLDRDRLYVTIFEGNEPEKLPKDDEAFNEWKKNIAEDHILPFGKKDNFWEMGDSGPCGPCTEIHVDCRSDEERKGIDGKSLVNADHPQVIEIWNNVFIQFNRLKDGSLEPLPAKHVDTGMGLERLVRVLQGKNSNYDTDLFTGAIAEVEKITGKQYTNADDKKDIAFRVIADHIRAIAFTIADGQLPSNTGAGYVIRRILRRAVRYYYSYLDYKQPLLYKLMPVLGKQFEIVFPELNSQMDFVTRVVKEEEDSFLRTIYTGIRRFSIYTTGVGNASGGGFAMEQIEDPEEDRKTFLSYVDIDFKERSYKERKKISGAFAFELNDTYGFPIDLTELMAREIDWTVDMDEFGKLLQQQKSRSRAATTLETEDWINLDFAGKTAFIGYYTSKTTDTHVTKFRKVKIKNENYYQLALSETPFYAEGGGQVGDTGILNFSGEIIDVVDTKRENDLILHYTKKFPSDYSYPRVIAEINCYRRKKIEIHHSATHLLHAALRKVLGTHVAQKGSLVNSEHLRFDFSHFAKVTDEEITRIEAIVNEKIRENVPVVIKEMSKDEAVAMGAMALFGEKYGDVVRVVIMDENYSVELCGGTHVGNTGELGYFKIKHETAVAAGVRRIEAVSGKSAEDFVNEQLNALNGIKEALKNPKDVKKALENMQAETAELKKKIESLEAKQLVSIKATLLTKVEDVNGISFIGEMVDVSSVDNLKKLCIDLKPNLKNFIVVLTANAEGKAQVAVMIDEAIVASKNLDATKIIKEHIAPLIRGGGGGQKTLSTAGGQDAGNLQQVIDKVKSLFS